MPFSLLLLLLRLLGDLLARTLTGDAALTAFGIVSPSDTSMIGLLRYGAKRLCEIPAVILNQSTSYRWDINMSEPHRTDPRLSLIHI